MRSSIAFICLVLAVLLSSTIGGESADFEFEKGWDAYVRGDYETALREWVPLAEHGHARAQANLGFLYVNGTGVPQDYTTAVKWYTLAAEQGNAAAQTNLGGLYKEGQGVSRDDTTAVKWYKLAAEQGDAYAQQSLGWMNETGRGTPQDHVRAHMWYNIAISQGNEGATESRDNVEEEMTRADISIAQNLAFNCVRKRYKGC